MIDAPQFVRTTSEALAPLFAVCISFIVLNTFFVCLRFTARALLHKQSYGSKKKRIYGLDDLLLIPAYIANIGICACGLVLVHYETIGNLPAADFIDQPQQLKTQLFPALKIFFVLELLVTPGYMLPKLSMLCLYLRIFTLKWMRTATYILIGLLCAICVVWFLAAIFQCKPVYYYWDRLVPGRCFDSQAFYRSYNYANIITDVVLLLLPVPAVWRLHVSTPKKIGLSLVFLCGSLGLAASCTRLAYFYIYQSIMISPDLSRALITPTIVEPGIYLIAACLPALRPIFVFLAPKRKPQSLNIPVKPTPVRPSHDPRHRYSKASTEKELISGDHSEDVEASDYYAAAARTREPTLTLQEMLKAGP